MNIYVFVTVSGTVYTLVNNHDAGLSVLTGDSRWAGPVLIRSRGFSWDDMMPVPVVGQPYKTDKGNGLTTSRVQFVSAIHGV